MAYQIGFDLYESATQQFLQRVQTSLKRMIPGFTMPSTSADGESVKSDADKRSALLFDLLQNITHYVIMS